MTAVVLCLPGGEGEGHQNALYPGARRGQAELHPPVVHQVKLHIPTTGIGDTRLSSCFSQVEHEQAHRSKVNWDLAPTGGRSPSSPDLLPVFLLLGEGLIEVLVDDGKVAGHHGAGAALHEAEGLLLARRVQVVKEDPPDAPGLPSVADVEVPVTPGQKTIM